MQESDKKLNLLKLKRLIDSGISSIPADSKHNSAVLVIGDTGVGKTTILSFLAKRKLFIKIHGLNTILDSDDSDGLKIGHDRFSETRVPAKIIIDKMVFFDCSGFKDNRGEQFEISNSFFVQRLFDIYQNIKILLIIDQSSVSEVRADKLPKLIRNLLKSFSTLTDIQDGVILLINRAKPEHSQKTYCDELLKMGKLKGQNGYLFNEEQRNFIEYLVKNRRVCLFKQAQIQDEGKVLDVKQENLMNLIRDAHFVKSKKIKNIISQSAKLCIRDFIDRLSIDAEEKIQKFSQEIVKQFTYQSKNAFSSGLDAAKETKKKIVQFANNIEKAKDENIVEVLRQNVDIDLTNFEQDVSAVLFFKNIYNKSDYFFKLIRSSISSSLTKLILGLDSEIALLEQQEKKMKELKEKNEESVKKVKSLAQQIAAAKQKQKQYQSMLVQANEKHKKSIEQLNGTFKVKQNEINKLNEQINKIRSNMTKNEEQNKTKSQQIAGLNQKLSSKDKQIAELVQLMNSLKIQNQSHSEELQMLHIENNSLKGQLDFALSQKSQKSQSSSLNDSKISKSSKYPDVICTHFKNGGQCVHCIKAWKAQQRKKKKQQQI